jgi:hypothetical protein
MSFMVVPLVKRIWNRFFSAFLPLSAATQPSEQRNWIRFTLRTSEGIVYTDLAIGRTAAEQSACQAAGGGWQVEA